MSTNQSGVIACHSISTTRPEAKDKKSPPFKVWPEINEWERYYALPTIGVIYRPEVLPHAIDRPFNYWPLEAMLEKLIRMFPTPEQFISQMMPMFEEHFHMAGEYYKSQFGIQFNPQRYQEALANVLPSLGEYVPINQSNLGTTENQNTVRSVLEYLCKLLSPEDVYSQAHEASHLYSFALLRPAVSQFKATWSAIEDLLHQAATGASDAFYDKFIDLNNKLKTCLTNYLSLEELRANIYALNGLPPEMQSTFINRVYGEESKQEKEKEYETFHSLQYLTEGRLNMAFQLTLIAECLDPSDPESELEQLQSSLTAQGAHTWSDEQWDSWIGSWNRLDTWKTILDLRDDLGNKPYSYLSTAPLTGRHDGIVMASCVENMRLPLFRESMRQQIGNLNCSSQDLI
jgi:hypothetical protein